MVSGPLPQLDAIARANAHRSADPEGACTDMASWTIGAAPQDTLIPEGRALAHALFVIGAVVPRHSAQSRT